SDRHGRSTNPAAVSPLDRLGRNSLRTFALRPSGVSDLPPARPATRSPRAGGAHGRGEQRHSDLQREGGNNGDAFGVANNTTMTVLDLLLATDRQAVGGVLYGGNTAKKGEANDLFSALNQAGGIG